MKPVVFITAGDPLGVGPEVTVKALKSPLVQHACSPIVIGEPCSLFRAGFSDRLARLISMDTCECLQDAPHGPTEAGGISSFKSVELACKLALRTGCPLVTAPISKQSWALGNIPYIGHTELLRDRAGKEGLMMFVSGSIRCALVSEHFAISDLPHILTRSRISQAARHFMEALHHLGVKRPHIAFCALNPHAGDNGKFGTEEHAVIEPVIRSLRRKGICVEGPFPVDSIWAAHAHGQYDGLLCMYHDQALLGLKLAAREPIVHVTAGLKFLRTSPTHGTAFDIAGKNKADAQSMTAAILFAASRAKCPEI